MTKIFSLAFKMKRRYYRKAVFFSGLKQFWPIDSHNQVIETLDRLSKKNKAQSISTFDFSTLYTKIPHNKLIDVLSIIAKSLYNDNTRRNIVLGKKTAYYVKNFSINYVFKPDAVIDCAKFFL